MTSIIFNAPYIFPCAIGDVAVPSQSILSVPGRPVETLLIQDQRGWTSKEWINRIQEGRYVSSGFKGQTTEIANCVVIRKVLVRDLL